MMWSALSPTVGSVSPGFNLIQRLLRNEWQPCLSGKNLIRTDSSFMISIRLLITVLFFVVFLNNENTIVWAASKGPKVWKLSDVLQNPKGNPFELDSEEERILTRYQLQEYKDLLKRRTLRGANSKFKRSMFYSGRFESKSIVSIYPVFSEKA